MGQFTNLELAQCAEREVGQRKYVYERRVADKKMTRENKEARARSLKRMSVVRELNRRGTMPPLLPDYSNRSA